MKTPKQKKLPDLETLAAKAKTAAEKAAKAEQAYNQAKLASMAYQYERMDEVCKMLDITFDEALEMLVRMKNGEADTGDTTVTPDVPDNAVNADDKK